MHGVNVPAKMILSNTCFTAITTLKRFVRAVTYSEVPLRVLRRIRNVYRISIRRFWRAVFSPMMDAKSYRPHQQQ